MIIFISIVTAIVFLVHLAVYKMFIVTFAISGGSALVLMRSVFVFLAVSFILSVIFASNFNNLLSRTLYTLSVTWLGFLGYLFLSSVVFSLCTLFAKLIDKPVNIVGMILIAVSIIGGIYGLIHARQIVVSEISVEVPNLPESWKGRRLVLVADMHLGQVNSRAFATKVVEKINSLSPDIVLMPGDLYDGVKVDEIDIVEPLRALRATFGTYFSTGNHENFGDNSKFLSAVSGTGIKVLNDEMIVVDGLQIIGVDDTTSTNRETFSRVVEGLGIDRGVASILMKHQPNLLEIPHDAGISLQVSGHTHRAQMFPFGYIPKLIYKGFDYGLNTFGTDSSLKVITTSGVGTWGPPMRVGTDSEIMLVTLR